MNQLQKNSEILSEVNQQVLFNNQIQSMTFFQALKMETELSNDGLLLVYTLALNELLFCLNEQMSDISKLDYAKKIMVVFADLGLYEIIYAFKSFIAGRYSVYTGGKFSFITVSRIIHEYRKEKSEYLPTSANLSGQL